MSVWRKNAKIWFDECYDILTALRNFSAAEAKKALKNEAVGRLTCLLVLIVHARFASTCYVSIAIE